MEETGAIDPDGDTAAAAIVLAGGRSSRFGADKTQALWRDTTLLERVLEPVCAWRDEGRLREVVVVGPWSPPGVRRVLEPVAGLGPLAGLAHGVSAVDAELVLVLAADHPLLRPELLQLLLEHARTDPTPDAVVPRGPDGPEPLVACYRRSVGVVAQAQLASGRRSLRGLLEELEVDWVEPDLWRRVDPEGWSFHDVDTPGDLVQLLERSHPQD